ncbi:MAG: hypothetical protein IJS53_05770, partial [Clostridia bacterium]|nr:hypothetical protein [Clostridia bacterium]
MKAKERLKRMIALTSALIMIFLSAAGSTESLIGEGGQDGNAETPAVQSTQPPAQEDEPTAGDPEEPAAQENEGSGEAAPGENEEQQEEEAEGDPEEESDEDNGSTSFTITIRKGPKDDEETVDDAVIYANDDIYLTGKMPGNAVVEATPVSVEIAGERVLAAYDVKIYANEKQQEKGKTWQPSDKKVQVHFRSDAFTDGQTVNVYHIPDTKSGPELVATTTVKDAWVEFEADSFSVYAVTVLEKTVETSDGKTYKITVAYCKDSGLPEDAEIRASEIRVDNEEYESYLRRAAETLGLDVSAVVYSRLFDIAIVDAKGTEYQPDERVTVSIELLDTQAGDVDNVRVVHFGDAPATKSLRSAAGTAEELKAETNGSTVTFNTDGFSTFSLIDTSLISRVVNAIFGTGDDKLYENDDIIVTGRMPLLGTVEATPVRVAIDGEDAVLAYDIKIYANAIMKLLGIVWQPGEDAVQVKMKSDALTAEAVNVYHLESTDGTPELVTRSVAVEDNTVTFDAASFSVYALTETVLTATVFASDGNTYEITVTYQNTAGIPMEGTALLVNEILPETAEYEYYLSESAKAGGTDTDHLALSRAFDIRIVDEADASVVYEPAGNVDVSIRLVGSTLEDYVDVFVTHFEENPDTGSVTASTVDTQVTEDTVAFTTDSFSVYAVGGTTYVRTFYFHTLNEYLDYEIYYLGEDTENETYYQIVRAGETPVVPMNPVNPQDQEATFVGWF